MAETPKGGITISVRDMPDLIWRLRHELAAILRDEAATEANPKFKVRLEQIATAYEAGQRRS